MPAFSHSEWCWESPCCISVAEEYSIGLNPPLLMYPFTWGKMLSFPSVWVLYNKCLWTFRAWCQNTTASCILSYCLTASSAPWRPGEEWDPLSSHQICLLAPDRMSLSFLRMCCLTQLSDSIPTHHVPDLKTESRYLKIQLWYQVNFTSDKSHWWHDPPTWQNEKDIPVCLPCPSPNPPHQSNSEKP